MFTATTRRLFLAAFTAIVALAVSSLDAEAKTVTDKFSYRLTDGDIREFAFTPGGAGQIRADADFRGAGVIRKEIAVRMKLIRPDGTIAKQVTGGSPLPLVFNLSPQEQQKFAGKKFKIRIENTVPQKDRDTIVGDLNVKFDDGKITVLNVKGLDVGPKATQERAFTVPGKAGRLTIDVKFRDGLLNRKEVVVELVRVTDGKVLARADGDSALKLTANLSATDRQLKVRITNKQAVTTVRGIDLFGILQPN